MLYAPSDLLGFAVVGGLGAGQINPVQWAATAFAKEAAKRTITLPSTRTVCDWLDYERSKRTPLGYARLVG